MKKEEEVRTEQFNRDLSQNKKKMKSKRKKKEFITGSEITIFN